jgi:P27 family predicted phage terminase small subunit
MRGGHNRKPIDDHRRNGSYRPHRHAGRNGIVLPVERPEPPADLSTDAREVWDRLCAHLEHLGTISRVDDIALRLMVDASMLYRQAMRDVHEHGAIYQRQTARGLVPTTNPSVSIADKLRRQVLDMAGDFGMTAAGRKALGLDIGSRQPDEDDAEIERILGMGQRLN